MDHPDALRLAATTTTFHADADGNARAADHGLAVAGTVHLARYAWRCLPSDRGALGVAARERFGDAGLELRLTPSAAPDASDVDGAWVRRRLDLRPDGLDDALEVVNDAAERRSLSLELDLAAPDGAVVDLDHDRWSARVAGSVVTVRFDALAAVRPDGADWELSLAPGERVRVGATVTLHGD